MSLGHLHEVRHMMTCELGFMDRSLFMAGGWHRREMFFLVTILLI